MMAVQAFVKKVQDKFSRDPNSDPWLLQMQLVFDIEKLIEPHTQRGGWDRPPFSTAELIVMAVACRKAYFARRSDILTWIVQTFPYYGMQALDNWAQVVSKRDEPRLHIPGFAHAFDDFELPLHEIALGSHRFFVTTMAARTFLRKQLERPRHGHFRFLDLPAELRNEIYEIVLTLPGSGIVCLREPRDEKTRTAKMRISVKGNVDETHTGFSSSATMFTWADNSHGVKVKLVARLLDLLLVNRQIYDEAMPIFYSKNGFYFQSAVSASYFIPRMGPRRLEHLKSVRLLLMLDDEDDASQLVFFEDAMAALLAVKSLKSLTIELRDSEWLGAGEEFGFLVESPEEEIKSAYDIVGFTDLAIVASRAEELVIRTPPFVEEDESEGKLRDDLLHIVSYVKKAKEE